MSTASLALTNVPIDVIDSVNLFSRSATTVHQRHFVNHPSGGHLCPLFPWRSSEILLRHGGIYSE